MNPLSVPRRRPPQRRHATGGAAPPDARTRIGRLARPGTFLLALGLACLAALPAGSVDRTPAAHAAVQPTQQDFVVTPADLAFILKQIKIAEFHVNNTTSATGPCGALVGTGPNQIPDRLTSYGVRTVDGRCNNLVPGREFFGASNQPFPRFGSAVFGDAEDSNVPGVGPVGPPGQTSYTSNRGNVVDSRPRTISNLIVDQTSTNPAAVAAAAFPIRSQNNPGKFPCTIDPDPLADPPIEGSPAGCVPSHQTLDIPNVTTDVGLSPPFNSLFTIFGQFFDHGLDLVAKRSDAVFIPLKGDDPLVAGPNHIFGDADDLPPNRRFMVLSRTVNLPGPDGISGDDPRTAQDESADDIKDGVNLDTPWVDQQQTYASTPSQQVFLREYQLNGAGKPVATGHLARQADGGMVTWGGVKDQSASVLGLKLVDSDVLNIPMVAADVYGNFIPGPSGFAQWVTDTGLVEGDPAGGGVAAPANVQRIGAPFLADIAHTADPTGGKSPDANTTIGDHNFGPGAGEYDDELLAAHFVAGDSRVNENVALTAVHQIFHSEHDRLVDDIVHTLSTNTTTAGLAAWADWQNTGPTTFTLGERLFQAARFVTEMEYQHLVFEEFARKVQPAIDPFHVYHTDINPAIRAEFAHAVYRFGHSMLDDDIPRVNANGAHNDIKLLDGFLNPLAYQDGGAAGHLTSEQAAGAIFMGLSDQVGNEIDEFVNETLRNNLLGLPLDLPTLNMTRARDTGTPPLNVFRRQIFNKTGDGQMAPYQNWVDFGLGLKHPESLVNFVAAYGQHDSITSQTTLAGKRNAAQLIVDPPLGTDPTLIPGDAVEFMTASGPFWSTHETGLNNVDLWVGGLAEKTNLFGGLLGSTFNYVFENTLVDLQNGDRLYYLARTPGLNLRTQLEGNSFAEMIMRNTNAHSLKQDAFGTADCKFELANLAGTAAGFTQFGQTVADDPASECDESLLLIRSPDGTIRYRTTNTVDPSGINGQGVYNGTPGVDRVVGGVDTDTIMGNEADDILQGQDGDDNILGGDGNDIIQDIAGADIMKGGNNNDAIDAGSGLDLILAGSGDDYGNGGLNDNEEFMGPGNDLVRAGDGADAAFGDSGDDWIEGGSGQDLLLGDHGAPFFDDPGQTAPGNDIMVGQVGENDYDAEGGDDILEMYPAIERNAGAGGWDFASHQYDGAAAADDMNFSLVGIPLQQVVNRDRWQETEGDSGSAFDDHMIGDNVVPINAGGAGFTGCDALDQAGIDRVAGLDPIVPPLNTPVAVVNAGSATGTCPLTGPNVWGDGNILLGGSGNDTIEGRGADDVIDGDRYLHVRLSVRGPLGNEIGSTDLLSGVYELGNPATLQQSLLAGDVDPGNVVPVREILVDPNAGADVDTAVFSGAFATYLVTRNADGSITVDSQGGADGVDTLWNVERLQFADRVVDATTIGQNAPATGTISLSSTTPTEGVALNATQAFTDADGINAATLVWTWEMDGAPNVFGPVTSASAGASFTPGAPEVGHALRVVANFQDNLGHAESITSPVTAAVAAAPVNTPATGAPTVTDTTPQEGVANSATSAGIADANGLAGVTFNFQWQESAAGGAAPFGDIAGATSATFTPAQAQVNRALRVVVSFTDQAGFPETVTSAATGVTGDLFTGTAGADAFAGTAGDDRAFGGAGVDNLQGNSGNDVLAGQAGDDTVNGGAGNDVIQFTGTGDGFDAVTGAAGTDRIEPTAANTNVGLRTLATTEQITSGGLAGLHVVGNAAANTLNFGAVALTGVVDIDGAGGADTLTGSAGVDVMVGGAGNDTMNTGAGNDTLRYAAGFGADTVNGFDANATGGQDKMDVSPLGLRAAQFGTAALRVTNVGGNARVTTTGGNTITLQGVAPAAITAADFTFAP